MFNTAKKIVRSCQSGLASSLRRLLGYRDGNYASQRTPLRTIHAGNGQRPAEPEPEPSLASEPRLSLAYEDAHKSATLTVEKLSPGTITQLHEALDDLASELPTDLED